MTLFCKVVEVLQDFLSENVDKKLHNVAVHMGRSLNRCVAVSFTVKLEVPAQVYILAILPHFCFPWGRPWGNHAKCCMDGNIIRCLSGPSPGIYFNRGEGPHDERGSASL